jgi:PHD/YefM family antitoxin component YafN of YafNO toxin-antitoxin module
VKATQSAPRRRSELTKLLKEAEVRIVPISRNGETVAYLISKDRLDSIIETAEIMSNPKGMKAIREDRAGRTKYYPIPKDLDDES